MQTVSDQVAERLRTDRRRALAPGETLPQASTCGAAWCLRGRSERDCAPQAEGLPRAARVGNSGLRRLRPGAARLALVGPCERGPRARRGDAGGKVGGSAPRRRPAHPRRGAQGHEPRTTWRGWRLWSRIRLSAWTNPMSMRRRSEASSGCLSRSLRTESYRC